MKKVMVVMLCVLLVGFSIRANAFYVPSIISKCIVKTPPAVFHHGLFNYAILAPVYAVGLIILSSQAWRNCKDQYPNAGPGRTACQANMNTWVMPSFNNLSPVTTP